MYAMKKILVAVVLGVALVGGLFLTNIALGDDHNDNDNDNDDDNNVAGQLKRVTYTVTPQDNNGDVVIPTFSTGMFFGTLRSDSEFNGIVRIQAQRVNGAFDDVATINEPDRNVYADNIRKRDSINTSDWADLTGPVRANYPFNLQVVVIQAPTDGQVEVEIIFLDDNDNDNDNDNDD